MEFNEQTHINFKFNMMLDDIMQRLEALEGLAAEYESERQQDAYEAEQAEEKAGVSDRYSVVGKIMGLQLAKLIAEDKAKESALNAARWEMVVSLHSDGDYAGVASFIDTVINGDATNA
ncbi:hypothetical protein DS608_21665 [Salmonella enterica subsp. enterica serovar Javiana]|nr:hypothetical protein [Salmonella enterica subsp. enterica serovar Javiana]